MNPSLVSFELVTGLEFLAMLVPHVQLRYECKIRLYGALSTTFRKRWGWIGKSPASPPLTEATPAEHEGNFTRARRRTWAELAKLPIVQVHSARAECGVDPLTDKEDPAASYSHLVSV